MKMRGMHTPIGGARNADLPAIRWLLDEENLPGRGLGRRLVEAVEILAAER